MAKERLGILFSGSGSTAERIVQEIQTGRFANLEMACAFTNNPRAEGIYKLAKLGIPVYVREQTNFRNKKGFYNKGQFGQEIITLFESHGVSVVTQNGWLPFTPENVIRRYTGKVFNQHPGPVPEFGGKGMVGIVVHEAVLLFARKVTRKISHTIVVAHRVTPVVDGGAIVSSLPVPLHRHDTAALLQKRALPIEHDNQIALLEHINRGTLINLPYEPFVGEGEHHLLTEAKQEAIEKYLRKK